MLTLYRERTAWGRGGWFAEYTTTDGRVISGDIHKTKRAAVVDALAESFLRRS